MSGIPLISSTQYRAHQRETLALPASCVSCGATIPEEEKEGGLPAWNEDATIIYWWCSVCDERNRRELAGPY